VQFSAKDPSMPARCGSHALQCQSKCGEPLQPGDVSGARRLHVNATRYCRWRLLVRFRSRVG
jgi:hypothetical protein